MSLLSSIREKSKKRKELLRTTLGVTDLSEALGTSEKKDSSSLQSSLSSSSSSSSLALGCASSTNDGDLCASDGVVSSSNVSGGTGSSTSTGSDRTDSKRHKKNSSRGDEFRDSTAFLKGTQSLNPHNDYSQNFVDTGHRPQNFIRDVGLADRFEEYPKLRELIRLKNELIAETAHPPMYLKCDLETFDLKTGLNHSKFDVILVEPPLEEYSRSCGVTNVKFWDWEKIMALDIGEVAASRSFIFLWCGSSDGLDLGRLCLQQWGFRRCEDICWIQTNPKTPHCSKVLEPNAVFQRTKEHCLMGIKGTVRRSTDGDFIHANVDIDLIIDEDPEPGSLDKPVEMFHIIEHFCLGTRRLQIFGRDTTIRPGWFTIGPELSMSNWDPNIYAGYFAEGTTSGCTEKIESLRPKSPPPKSGGRGRGRGRGRGGGGGGGGRGGGGR